jgi:prevent-host-death family protein
MSETVVNIHEAKTHLSRLIERAEAGETIIIAKAGTPKVVLSPVPRVLARRPGRFAGAVRLASDFDAPLPVEELAAWEGADS